MATSSEAEKYEVLETIGNIRLGHQFYADSMLIVTTGRGSFGTIRKVRRASDGHVCKNSQSLEN